LEWLLRHWPGSSAQVSLGIADSTSNLRIHHRAVVDTPTVMGRLQGL
jgi:hypothetical protein